MAGILNGFDVRTPLQVGSEDALGDAPEIHFFLQKIQCEGFFVYLIWKTVRKILRIKFPENGAGGEGGWGRGDGGVLLPAWRFYLPPLPTREMYVYPTRKNFARNTRVLIGTNFRVELGTHNLFADNYMTDVHVVLAEHLLLKSTQFQLDWSKHGLVHVQPYRFPHS